MLGRRSISPQAVLGRVAWLEGLLQVFIATGALKLFLGEDIEYARGGWPVRACHGAACRPGAFHTFYDDAVVRLGRAVRRNWLAALQRASDPI